MWGGPPPPEGELLVTQAVAAGFDGIEGPPPEESTACDLFKRLLVDHGLQYVAEATTGVDRAYCQAAQIDWWVPAPHKTPDDHLDDLKRTVDQAVDLNALFVTTMTGYDAWPFAQQVDYFGRALELEAQCPISISFETHRSRSLFNPWITRDLLTAHPSLKLTVDFSHWCVVCERLIDSEADIIQLCADHAWHIHARVGHPQGAQVPDPRPGSQAVYQRALAAHEAWWDAVWCSQDRRGFQTSTLTPEFGPEGYWHTNPYTGEPTCELWPIVQWQATRQRERFNRGAWRTGSLKDRVHDMDSIPLS